MNRVVRPGVLQSDNGAHMDEDDVTLSLPVSKGSVGRVDRASRTRVRPRRDVLCPTVVRRSVRFLLVVFRTELSRDQVHSSWRGGIWTLRGKLSSWRVLREVKRAQRVERPSRSRGRAS